MRSLIVLFAAQALLAQVRYSGACVAEGYGSGEPYPMPETANRVVVILGSSTAAGVGASQQSESWAAGLEALLSGHGFRILNPSIPGTATAESLARFAKDVTPHQPAFVFLTTSLLNENFLANPTGAVERYWSNTLALIERTRRIGAIPVLMTMYPNTRFARPELDQIERWTQIAESIGWPVLNFMSPVSDHDGRWIDGVTADGFHPTDRGHRQMLDSIPDSLLVSLLAENPLLPVSPVKASWRAPENGETAHPLVIQMNRPVSSWTAAAFIRDPAITEEVDYFEALGDQPIRLSRRMDKIELWAGSERIWSRTAPAVGWRHFALSYQALTGRILIVIDGAVWGGTDGPVMSTFTSISVAGRCRGCGIAHLLAYRANLHPGEMRALAGRAVLRRSLEFRDSLSSEPVDKRGINLAQTLTVLAVDGAWALDFTRFPTDCDPLEESGDINKGGLR